MQRSAAYITYCSTCHQLSRHPHWHLRHIKHVHPYSSCKHAVPAMWGAHRPLARPQTCSIEAFTHRPACHCGAGASARASASAQAASAGQQQPQPAAAQRLASSWVVPSQPAPQAAPQPASQLAEPVLRRSTRAGKGVTRRFVDFCWDDHPAQPPQQPGATGKRAA